MNVLVIPYNYPTIENPHRAIFISDQVTMLRNQGHDVVVLGVIPKTLSDILSSKSIAFGRLSSDKWLVSLPAIRGFSKFNRWLKLCVGKLLIRKYFKSQHSNGLPDVLHVHNSLSAELALWVKDEYGIPFVVTEHSSLMWLNSNELSKLVFKESKANIAVSKKFSQHLSAIYQVEFSYVPNVVDTSYFYPLREGAELSKIEVDSDMKTFISVGNLTQNKNHKIAIIALKELSLKYSNVKLVIVGDGPEKNSLQSLIEELGLCSKVFLLGHLSRSQIRELLWKSDFFLLPSKRETFGVVLIEAMAAGLPVFSLKNGGSESIVTNEVGILADTEQDFIEGIDKLLVKKFHRNKILDYTYSNFSEEVVSESLISIYSEK